MTSIKAAKWGLVPGFRLHWQSWDDEFVVYNSGSGDTHLLDFLAAKVLQILEREEASLGELTGRVGASVKTEPDSELCAYLEKLLSDFYKLGLIERVEE